MGTAGAYFTGPNVINFSIEAPLSSSRQPKKQQNITFKKEIASFSPILFHENLQNQ